jgi:membrane carboxypeptidase/penicillin-binding protein
MNAIAAHKAQARDIHRLRAMDILNIYSTLSFHIRKIEFTIIIATAMVGGHQMLSRTHVLSPFDNKKAQVERASATLARWYLEAYAQKHQASSLEKHTKAANYKVRPIYLASQYIQVQVQEKYIKAMLPAMPCYYNRGSQAFRMLGCSVLSTCDPGCDIPANDAPTPSLSFSPY